MNPNISKKKGAIMTENLLSADDCRSCPEKCCKFLDPSHLPVLTPDERDRAKRNDVKFTDFRNLHKIESEAKTPDGKTICPFLNENSGCSLDFHPFQCAIWPFYAMRFESKMVIALSPNCPFVNLRSLKEILDAANGKIYNYIKMITDEFPGLIEDYYDEAVIIKIIG